MSKDNTSEILEALSGSAGSDERHVDYVEFDEDGNPLVEYSPEDTSPRVLKEEYPDIDIETDEPVAPVVETQEEPIQTENVPEEPVIDEAEKKTSRSQERIRELARKASEEAAKRRELEDRLRAVEATYAKNMESVVEKEIQEHRKALAEAISEGDVDKQVSAQEALQDAKDQLARLKQVSEAVPNPPSNIPSAAVEWAKGKEVITTNSAYKDLTPEQRKIVLPIRKAIPEIAKEMIEVDKFDPQDPFFYEELDMRLSDKFPHYADLAMGGIDAVDLNKSVEKPSTDDSPSSASKQLSSAEKAKKTPVKGPVPPSAPPKPSGVKSVKIAPDQMRYYNDYLKPYGVSLEDYAKEIERDAKAV